MDVDERSGGKGGEAPKADRDTDRLADLICQKNQGCRMPLKPWDQPDARFRRKGLSIAHWVTGVGVHKIKNCLLMIWERKICLDDFDWLHERRLQAEIE